MKTSLYNKISGRILAVFLLITMVITAWFFIDYVAEANKGDTSGTSALLYWLYTVLLVTFVALLGGILWGHFKKTK